MHRHFNEHPTYGTACFLIALLLAFGCASNARAQATSEEAEYQQQLELKQLYDQAMTAGHSNPDAALKLGVKYLHLIKGPDYNMARGWFEQASEAGNPEAMFYLGMLYENGWGVPLNYELARKSYERAAKLSCADAEHALGAMYDAGHGVKADPKTARKWYDKATAHGYRADAMAAVSPTANRVNAPAASAASPSKQVRSNSGSAPQSQPPAPATETAAIAKPAAQTSQATVNPVTTQPASQAASPGVQTTSSTPAQPQAPSTPSQTVVQQSAAPKPIQAAQSAPPLQTTAQAPPSPVIVQQKPPAQPMVSQPVAFAAAPSSAFQPAATTPQVSITSLLNVSAPPQRKWDEAELSSRPLLIIDTGCALGEPSKPKDPAEIFSTISRVGLPENVDSGALVAWSEAEKRDPQAQLNLGKAFALGLGTSRNVAKAEGYFRSASEHLPEAAFDLGALYEHGGDGIAPSMQRAAEYYKKAADKDWTDAQVRLALAYENGDGVIRSADKARDLYRKAAEKGVAEAQYRLGHILMSKGKKKETADGRAWMEKAADQNHIEARVELGLQPPPPPPDAVKLAPVDLVGIDVLKISEASASNPTAALVMGTLRAKGGISNVNQDFPEALNKLRFAADRDVAEAQFDLGVLNEKACGMPAADLAAAAKWYARSALQRYPYALKHLQALTTSKKAPVAVQKFSELALAAAERNDAASLHAVADQYAKGISGTPDYEEAVYWYQLAAAKGSQDAVLSLANLYVKGQGVTQDCTRGHSFYEFAAQSASPQASFMLGQMSEQGTCTTVNYALALNTYARLARQAYKPAIERLSELANAPGLPGSTSSIARNIVEATAQQNADAAAQIAARFERGEELPQDGAEARVWYLFAATRGLPAAQFNLANLFANGIGGVKDLSEAIRYYDLAAQQGYPAALFEMGKRYRTGDSVSKDEDRARQYLQKAADAGDAEAKNYLNAWLNPQPVTPNPTVASNNPAPGAGAPPANAASTAPAVKPEYAAVDTPPNITVQPKAHAYGLVIGVERYNAFPEVPGAVNDATVMTRYMQAVLGVPEGHIKHVENPTLSQIRQGVTWLENQAKADAITAHDVTLYVYYAGHGYPDARNHAPYLVPVDSAPDYVTENGVSLAAVVQHLSELDARTVMFIDSCFSGVAARADHSKVMSLGGGRALSAEDIAADLFSAEEQHPQTQPKTRKRTQTKAPAEAQGKQTGQVVVISASTGEQISNPLPGSNHGMFTFYLLRGLSGEAKDQQGNITISSLYDYVHENVKSEAMRNNWEQDPELAPRDAGAMKSFVLASMSQTPPQPAK